MSTNKNTVKHNRGVTKTIALIAVVLFIAVIIFLLFYKKETVTPTELGNTVSYRGIICTRNRQADDEVLKTTNPVSVKETAMVVYRNGEFEKISFTYEGEYADNAGAVKAENELHAGYYTYIGPRGIDIIDYANNYNIVGNKVVMNLASSKPDTPSSILKLYSYELNDRLDEVSEEKIIQNYSAKGFNCTKQ